ncbi:YciI family protein [Actinomadura opuntiae]|uniref:YciI family protein n=1 Tax=Actinomadura sp. OS1-43 TaxID=604315 RepID=UPI00255B29FB|nr:YciI family protein [Actinomadura sp. OS1-43]MDL4816987.1 YciI family protein [Actinomadura sp. OS1-43]
MLHLLRLEYTESEQAAEPHIKDHVAFLDRHHAVGTFLVSGQTVPSDDGGLIIAAGVDRATAEKISAEDPFVRAGVGRYTITTITPARTHPALTDLLPPK